MNTENQNVSKPGEPGLTSDDLTPAEMSYFTSRGEDTSAFETPATPDPVTTTVPVATVNFDPAPVSTDDDDVASIEITSDGKMRDAKTGRFVPHGAFHAERTKRKTTEAELQKARETLARADERLNVLNQVLSGADQATTEQSESPPNADEDPIGYMKHQAKAIESLQNKLKDNDTRQQAATTQQQVQTIVREDEVRFKTEKPDYDQAYAHLIQGRDKEYEAMGITDPAQRQARIVQDARALVAQALQNRKSPAQAVYDLAVARGYNVKAPAPAAAAKLKTIKDGQDRTASLSGAGGAPDNAAWTMESLANLPQEEFDKKVAGLSTGQLKRLMGYA